MANWRAGGRLSLCGCAGAAPGVLLVTRCSRWCRADDRQLCAFRNRVGAEYLQDGNGDPGILLR